LGFGNKLSRNPQNNDEALVSSSSAVNCSAIRRSQWSCTNAMVVRESN